MTKHSTLLTQLTSLLILTCLCWSCQPSSTSMPDREDAPYNFQEPTSEFILPTSLKEISGLSWSPEGLLCAVQDEAGILYRIDPENGSIVDQEKFWKAGDFEGIEVAGDRIWAIKSNGNLYTWKKGEGPKETKKYKTSLGKDKDVEGLARDEKRGQLIIVCKEKSYHSIPDKKGYEVWKFDEYSHKLSEGPIRMLQDGDREEEGCSSKGLSPGGIAVHPQTKAWYVVSAKNGWLSIFEEGEYPVFQTCLIETGMPQVEGICFSPNGTLYISSEANGKIPAKIRAYAPL